jgi:hypothetical protein
MITSSTSRSNGSDTSTTKPRGATAYDGTEPHREWFTRTMSVDATTFRMIKLAFRQGGMKRTMPIYRESVETINDIRDLGLRSG